MRSAYFCYMTCKIDLARALPEKGRLVGAMAFVFVGGVLGAGVADGQSNTPAPPKGEPVAYVDPYIGTGGHGHTFLGASFPCGAVLAGPTNIVKGWEWCSGYHYSDCVVTGFSQMHLSGTGIGDLGDVLIMPYTGSIKTK